MRRISALSAAVLFGFSAHLNAATPIVNIPPNAIPPADASAAAPTRTEGKPAPLSVDLSGALRVTGSFSASLSGFTPNGSFANLTATASSASVALPSGLTVQFQNAGTTAVSCTLGVGSATALVSELIIQPGSTKSAAVGSNTFAACIDQTGSASNLVVLAGGSGLGLDSGGGGGGSGGGGGASTIADGADATLGAIADAAWSGSGSGTLIAVSKYIGAKVEAVRALLAGTLTIGGTVATTAADGTNVTIGAKADAKSAATDTTSITLMSVVKQISASAQAAASSLAGTLTATVTNAGTFLVQAAQSGTWNITNISGTISLPTGAATAANQATANASLASIDTKASSAIPAGAALIGSVGTLAPAGSTQITASATGTTAATTATLAGTSAKTTYLCGFSIRANATAAATANSTVTGTITGTLNFTQWTAPLASGIGLTEQIFSPCVPASATNAGIAVISAAPGSGGVVSVTAWGFQL